MSAAYQTPAVMGNFFLVMMLYPEAQAKAQAEIDRVVGHERLPMMEDRPNLPYVEALIKELLRFYPPVPLGGLFLLFSSLPVFLLSITRRPQHFRISVAEMISMTDT